MRKSLVIVFALAVFYLAGCKDPSGIGSEIIPGQNGSSLFTDTFSLVTTVLKEEPLQTEDLSIHLLGSSEDPVFGRSSAGIFTQLRFISKQVTFGDNPVLDSVVLTLDYEGFYGDQSAPQSIGVYEILESMEPAAEYYSDKQFSYDPEALGTKLNFIPNIEDSVIVNNIPEPAHLRIRLSDTFGQRILDQSGTPNLADQQSFLAYFKGIYIAPITTSGYSKGIMYLDLVSSRSGITFYYKNDTVASIRKLIIEDGLANSNYYYHDFQGSLAGNFLNNALAEQDSIVFVEGMAGLKTKINIPNLADFKGAKKISIVRAELTVQQVAGLADDSIAPAPAQLLLVQSDAQGNNVSIPDLDVNSPSYYGGDALLEVNEAGELVYTYKFNISLHLQNILDGKTPDYGLFLISFGGFQSADKIAAGGGNNDRYKMKLNLFYTENE